MKTTSFFVGLFIISMLVIAGCTMPGSTSPTTTTGAVLSGTDRPTPPTGERPRDQGFGGYSLTEEQKNTCGITVQTTEGPYYIQNTPQLADNMSLNPTGLAGTPFILTGKVYGGLDNTTPLSGAKIEIRQADNNGNYHPQANGDYSSYDASKVLLRGYVVTDAEGNYTIQTIMPALYEGRARHVHLRISADEYNPVITQLILPQEGDTPTPENDNVAQGLPNCQIIDEPKGANNYTVNFDFRLKAE